MSSRPGIAFLAAMLTAVVVWAPLHAADPPDALPDMGPAPEFSLSDEKGGTTSLANLQGKVVLVSFMFTRCYDICPILTTKLADLQDELVGDYADDVYFVSITVDPSHDRPEVLREFAEAMAYHPDGWAFLTGSRREVRRVANAYGVLMVERGAASIDHTLLTTVIDRDGDMRVQYLGERFDIEDLKADILRLVN